MKLKVVYFTVIPLDLGSNGGTMCCRNHINRLGSDSNIDLFVAVASTQDQKKGTLTYLDSLQVPGKFIQFKDEDQSKWMRHFKRMFSLLWKGSPSCQTHVDEELRAILKEQNADILLIDYFYSALFCPKAIKLSSKAVLVNLNREIEFFKDLLKSQTKSPFRRALRMVRIIRLWWLECSVFRSMDRVIALSPPDVLRKKDTYITPYLDPVAQQWNPNSSRTIFFVGSFLHYPNKIAMEYIVTKLAPELVALIPDVRIKIIGASSCDLPYNHESVDFLGAADRQEVERQFLNCQLFICPIKNTFGLKFKLAQALAYGTPFLASPESLQCLPHLKGLPTISLHNPKEAAKVIAAHSIDEASSKSLAESIKVRHDQFIETQGDIWSRTLRGLYSGIAK